jgi:hypothetical protein
MTTMRSAQAVATLARRDFRAGRGRADNRSEERRFQFCRGCSRSPQAWHDDRVLSDGAGAAGRLRIRPQSVSS